MNTWLKPLFLTGFILASLLVAAKVTTGQECQQLYGGGQICPRGEVLIDKLVRNPGSGNFVDNLGTNDPKLAAGQEVTFRLTVKNVSAVLLDRVDVFDILPAELEYVSGPNGATYDANSRELRFVVENLAANESRDFEVKARVVGADRLPTDRSLICVTNRGEARIPENTDVDTAQVCIERPVVGELPSAGPAEWLLLLTGSGVLGAAGLKLIKLGKQ